MSFSLSGFFASVEGFFQKLFGKSANYLHFALAAITYAAPVLEVVLGAVDPAVNAIVTPVITRIESGLAVAYTLANEGSASANPLATTLQGVLTDFKTLSSVAGIKDPATQAKITTILSEIEAVLAMIPSTAPATPEATS